MILSPITRSEYAPETSGAQLSSPPRTSVEVEIVVPVYNEERPLPGCISALHSYLTWHFPVPWRITVVNNASSDSTADVAASLARAYQGVGVLNLDRKGRGLALKEAWMRSDSDVVAYVDVDLSTGLDAGRARSQAGDRVALLQHVDQALARRALLRRAVRVQGWVFK